MDADTLADHLETTGHLHLFLDSGAEFAVSRHDTHIDTDDAMVDIDSKEGDWQFPVDKVEWVDTEPSGLESEA